MMKLNLSRLSDAERLLWDYGVTAPEHIDLEAIAADRGAEVRYRPLEGCEARLVAFNNRAVISINSESSLGRRRFSLGHEIAHWENDAKNGAFHCASTDISPRGAEGKSVEARANNFASQLVLPDYLSVPWIAQKPATLDVAAELKDLFNVSITAAAIKLINRCASPAAIVCHSKTKLDWFCRSKTFPSEFFLSGELHQDTDAFSIAFGSTIGKSRLKRESANRWFSGGGAYRYFVQSQSLKLPNQTVLTSLSFIN